jgi:hypothetical protein
MEATKAQNWGVESQKKKRNMIRRLGKVEGREIGEELLRTSRHGMKNVFVPSQDILKIS